MEYPQTKPSIVERFQRTLKSRMWKYFTHHRTLRYLDVLQKLVHGYNQAYHRNTLLVGQRSKRNSSIRGSVRKIVQTCRAKTKSGRYRAYHKTKRIFEKGYLPNVPGDPKPVGLK